MNGKTHRIFGAILTTGVTYLTFKNGNYGEVNNGLTLLASALGGFTGYRSACWADADLHFWKPYNVIWGTAQKTAGGYRARVYDVDKKRHVVKTVSGVRGFDTKVFASLFKIMMIKEHRGWQSHSPVLWVPIWLLLLTLLKPFVDFNVAQIPIGLCIYLIGFWCCLGYLSHIIADCFTTDGITMIPDFKHVPGLNKLDGLKFQPFRIKIFGKYIFKAGSKIWNIIFIGLALEVFLFFLAPSAWKATNGLLVDMLKNLFGGLLSLVPKLFQIIKEFISTLLSH